MIRRVIANARASLTLIAALTLLLFTLGCGNKGPLYLPTAADTPQPGHANAPADDKDD